MYLWHGATHEPPTGVTMYHAVQESRQAMQDLMRDLREALLASNTREVANAATKGMADADRALRILKSGLEDDRSPGVGQRSADRGLVEAAVAALNRAWTDTEKVELGRDVDEMRGVVYDIKTQADYADAYLAAAVGWEDTTL